MSMPKRPRPDDAPLGCLGLAFAAVLIAFALALFDAATQPGQFAP